MSTTFATPSKCFTSTPEAWLLGRWQTMLRIRRAEEAIAEMSESGEARCPCHLSIGQEAVPAGVCAALDPGDTIWGGHRSHGHYLAQGGSLEGLFAEVLGKTTGCAAGRGGSMHLIAPERGIPGTVPIVAGTVPLAAGAAQPTAKGFIAFEPMVGITNALNLSQKGIYKELQTIPAGGSWEESFWISTKGY